VGISDDLKVASAFARRSERLKLQITTLNMSESNKNTAPHLPERLCLRDAIIEIKLAAGYLNQAVSAHILGNTKQAEDFIRAANVAAIRDWVESLWGKNSPYVQYRAVPDAPPTFSRTSRAQMRMPSSAEKRLLHARDGYHCRFCGIPVIRAEIRNLLRKLYPDALPWPNRKRHSRLPGIVGAIRPRPPACKRGNE
jgi:hypothetical protein